MDSSGTSDHNESSWMGIDDFLPETSFDNKSDDNPYSINVIERECRPNEYKLIGVWN